MHASVHSRNHIMHGSLPYGRRCQSRHAKRLTMEVRLLTMSPEGGEVGGPPAAAACKLPGSAAGAKPNGDRMSRIGPAHSQHRQQ